MTYADRKIKEALVGRLFSLGKRTAALDLMRDKITIQQAQELLR